MNDNTPSLRQIECKIDYLIGKWVLGGDARAEAESEFRTFTAAEASVLLDLLSERKRLREQQIQSPILILTLVFWFLIAAERFTKLQLFEHGAILLAAGFLAVVSVTIQRFFRRDDTSQIIALLQTKQTFPILLENVQFAFGTVKATSKSALIKILPELNEDDAVLFTAEVRANIHKALINQSPSLVLPLLRALEILGDGRDLVEVERLAIYRMGIASKNEEVRKAAMNLVPILRERAEQDRVSGTLLRAAEAPAEDTLLKPIQTPGATEMEMLHRPKGAPNAK